MNLAVTFLSLAAISWSVHAYSAELPCMSKTLIGTWEVADSSLRPTQDYYLGKIFVIEGVKDSAGRVQTNKIKAGFAGTRADIYMVENQGRSSSGSCTLTETRTGMQNQIKLRGNSITLSDWRSLYIDVLGSTSIRDSTLYNGLILLRPVQLGSLDAEIAEETTLLKTYEDSNTGKWGVLRGGQGRLKDYSCEARGAKLPQISDVKTLMSSFGAVDSNSTTGSFSYRGVDVLHVYDVTSQDKLSKLSGLFLGRLAANQPYTYNAFPLAEQNTYAVFIRKLKYKGDDYSSTWEVSYYLLIYQPKFTTPDPTSKVVSPADNVNNLRPENLRQLKICLIK